MRAWNVLREVEWFAVLAVVLLAAAVVIVLWTPLTTFGIVVAIAAVVSAVFSYRV